MSSDVYYMGQRELYTTPSENGVKIVYAPPDGIMDEGLWRNVLYRDTRLCTKG
ncbi:MAG: hypothetical protein U9Q68_12405 [Euryarchaeota archaeon]|nr:hypothetical protein [Euryarchaeota archaeon]